MKTFLSMDNRKGNVSIFDIEKHKFVSLRGKNFVNAVLEFRGDLKETVERITKGDNKAILPNRKRIIEAVRILNGK